MARSRNIKPGIVLNDALAGLAHWVRLLFIYLWTIADREGRLEDNPRRIGAALFPYEAELSFDEGLQQLHEAGFILRYQVDGERFIEIMNWSKHQNPHPKENASDIPSPMTSNELVTAMPRLVTAKPERERPLPSSLLLIPSLPHTAIAESANRFQEFLDAYPKKTKHDATARAYVSTITTDQQHADLMAGLERWKASRQWVESLETNGDKFIPDPDKFIFDRRWLDHPLPASVARPDPKPSSAGIDPNAEWQRPADWVEETDGGAAFC